MLNINPDMTSRSLFLLWFLSLLVSIGSIPLGSEFTGWNALPQTVEGTFQAFINLPYGLPPFTTGGPAIISVDPNHKQYMVNLTQVAGIQWTMENGTYFQIAGICTFDSEYGTYDKMVATYNQVRKIDQRGSIDVYFGYPNEFATCGLGIGTGFLLDGLTGAILQQTWTQWAPSVFGLPSYTTVGNINITHIELGQVRIPPLPESCWRLNVSLPSSQYCKFFQFPPMSYNSVDRWF